MPPYRVDRYLSTEQESFFELVRTLQQERGGGLGIGATLYIDGGTMRNRRDRRFGNSIVVHITNRTLKGLPFVMRPFMNVLLIGILARAQSLFGVQICHFVWMGNHFHIILAGRAKLISPFMCYLQGETAKMLKKLVPGFFESKVWAGRYKEQKLCTAGDVIDMIVYMYSNPARA